MSVLRLQPYGDGRFHKTRALTASFNYRLVQGGVCRGVPWLWRRRRSFYGPDYLEPEQKWTESDLSEKWTSKAVTCNLKVPLEMLFRIASRLDQVEWLS